MNVSAKSGFIEIRVDRKTELLGIIQIISNYRKKFPQLLEKHGNKDYVEQIERQFGKYKDHMVVKLFDEIVLNNNFCYDAPVDLFLQLNDDFSYTKLKDYPIKTRLKNDSRVIEMLDLLKSFAKEIDFEEFYEQNKDRYSMFVNNTVSQLGSNNLIEYILNYYNLSNKNNFIVNLLPFQTWGNYGIQINNDLYSNICGSHETNKEDEIFPDETIPNGLIYLLHHEFSHSFINPLTDKYSTIKNDDTTFCEIFETMEKQAYGDTSTIINEHIIRALTLRYRLHVTGDISKYEQRTNIEKELGFIYIESILNSLITYENKRDTYKNIEEFYPVIINNMFKDYEASKENKR